MEVVVLHVHCEEAEDLTGHEAEDGDKAVDHAEDDEEEACVAVRSRSDKSDEPCDDVDDVMDGVDLEDEERAIDEEAGDADKQ